ncbi:non-classical arabinogalactan protein 30-like [Musa acuminata AAA Group]|uniref:non-classical arabinogalactan protein 30-like n=1 Tax=Musa acuminata AAA Group TaxID=214697 RepID=UPI0031E46BA3
MALTKTLVLLALQLILLVVSFPPSATALSFPPRYGVAVEGAIYCKCELPGYVGSLGASPLPGAVAMLRCNSSRPGASASAVTDVRGRFLIQTTKVTNYEIHKCKLFLVSSPLPGCDVPAGHYGGFPLKFVRNTVAGATKRALYTVGPFKLAPADPSLCPHHP